MSINIGLFLLFCGLVYSAPPKSFPQYEEATNCGYQSCHPVKDGMINVHIVPHTHDDVGWLKTVDQYYYGHRNSIQTAGVQYILDTVMDALAKDPNRRFIYVETAFFWKWWIKQHDIVKSQVRKFVNNGQLEFIGGAWSMNDEAVTNYQSIIDQFTWGLRKLNDTFGECGRPKIGWQIDPFGHSREMASIFAQLGFDGLLLGRIDYQDKKLRFSSKTPEMVWRGSSNLGEASDIFTGVMYNTYGPPPGFCFDILCPDEPIIDDKKSPDYNVDRRVNDLFEYLKNVSNSYATSNIIITMGEDFHYQDAHVWFKNLDKLIYYANERQTNGSKYNLIYSTPSCYVKSIYNETKGNNSTFRMKEDDFFPYSSDPHAFWTGYYTSRPTIKRFEREGNNFLQICKQLYALTDLDPVDYVDLNVLREAMGVMQHHDAITGTEKEHVAYDYTRILQNGFDECQFIAATALSKIVSPNTSSIADEPTPTPAIQFESCLLSNISSCPISESQKRFVVTVYNPLSRPVDKYVRLPVQGTNYAVTGPDGSSIDIQLIPIAEPILNIPGRESNTTIELIFIASNLPPLGFKSYFVEEKNGDRVLKPSKQLLKEGSVYFEIGESGFLSSITINNKTLPISQEFLYYEGAVGNNAVFENRSSGAYIFRPNGTNAYPVTDKVKVTTYAGYLVSEIHQTFNEWASQIIRIYSKENYVEFDWIVGPLPRTGDNGKEVISRFKTNLTSDAIFYTDSNGRELLKRVRDFRPTWNLDLQEPIAGNYYPVTSKILIRDEKNDLELAVLTDRAQGGSSLKDGQIELMVNRICFHDDAFGVGEALMEKAYNKSLVVRGSHYLIFGPYLNSKEGKSIAAQERDIAQRKLLSAWTFLSTTNETSFDHYKTSHQLEFAGLSRPLPDNVQILTLEPWKGFSFLIRLEHVLEKGEDANLSQTVNVDLKNLFVPFEIISLEETTLAANQWLKDNNRLHFDNAGSLEDLVESTNKFEEESRRKWNRDIPRFENYVKRDTKNQSFNQESKNDYEIVLQPMQIRTFIIEIEKRNSTATK